MGFRIDDRVAWQMINDEAVLVDVAGARVLALSETASFLWTRIEDQEPGTIAADMADSFDVSEGRAREDIDEFLAELVARGLISVVEE